MVSTNTPVILIYPCRTGSSVCAAAALIPPAPSPASFENTPREIPYRRGRRQQGNSGTHRASRCRPERKRVPYYRRAVSAEALRRADRLPFLPRPDKKVPYPVPIPPPLLQWNAVRLSQRAAEESSAPTRFFLLPRQTYPASPAQSSSPASYCPFREIPARCFRQKTQPASSPAAPPERLWSASPSDRRSMFRLFFASGTAQKESSPKISVQVPINRCQHHPSPVLPVLQAPLRRQPPRYCPSRSPPQVPSSAMRTAKHLLLLVSPVRLALAAKRCPKCKEPDRRTGSARSWIIRKMPVPSSRKRSGGPQAAAFTAFRNAWIFSSMAISIPPCTKFQRKAVSVPPLLNGFLSMHHNVFFALYAAAAQKKNPTAALQPRPVLSDVHPILLYSAFARSSGFLLF